MNFFDIEIKLTKLSRYKLGLYSIVIWFNNNVSEIIYDIFTQICKRERERGGEVDFWFGYHWGEISNEEETLWSVILKDKN